MDCSPSGPSVHGSLQTRIRGCHALLQGNLPDPGIKPASLMSPPLAGRFFTTTAVWEARLDSQGLNNRHFLLRVLEARSPMSEFQHSWVLGKVRSRPVDTAFLDPQWQRPHTKCFLFCGPYDLVALIPVGKAPPSQPNYFPRAPPLNLITSDVRASRC